jgi:hypothetical protein
MSPLTGWYIRRRAQQVLHRFGVSIYQSPGRDDGAVHGNRYRERVGTSRDLAS